MTSAGISQSQSKPPHKASEGRKGPGGERKSPRLLLTMAMPTDPTHTILQTPENIPACGLFLHLRVGGANKEEGILVAKCLETS